MAQNAADAAGRVGVPGRLSVRLENGVLAVANTGAPLDLSGVHALTALRVSAKTAGVGRFGVGFTAVRAVSDEIEVRSRSGGIMFSAKRTRGELAAAGLSVPELGVPVLRLAWPAVDAPRDGFDSEVVLHLAPEVDAAALMSEMESEAIDLLLELEGLAEISVGDRVLTRSIAALTDDLDELTIGTDTWWQHRTAHARWLVPVVNGSPRPVDSDVLRAPTRSDEELSLPAIVIADVAMQPDRRRILPGTPVERVAAGYRRFIAALPPRHRPAFVPIPGFARSAVDGVLRERIVEELRSEAWLPGYDGRDLIPSRAVVLPGLTDDLASMLADVVPDLVGPDLSGHRYSAALAAVDVHRIGPARVADMLGGLDREPSWWGRLYDAMNSLAVDGVSLEELAALPVPLTDGRLVTGPRTAVIATDAIGDVPVDWARVVHPDAARPLLERLGARQATAADLLADPVLRARLDDLDWDDIAELEALTASVLGLAGVAASSPEWLGLLPLTDTTGELRPADELLLPGAPLARLMVSDSPFGVVAESIVFEHGAEALRRVGVGWSFGVVRDDLPTGPDHDLDDESSWWAGLSDDPPEMAAVRDLDLVDVDAWPDALTELLNDQATRPLLEDRLGYTAWWLRRHASIGGVPIGEYRAPSDYTFAGLLDSLDHPQADALAALCAPAACDGNRMASLLLSRLADENRTPSPAVTAQAHRLLAAAVGSGLLDVTDLDVPPRVRSVSGATVDPDSAIVLDRPWFAAVVPLDVAVLSDMATAPALAELLDVRAASECIEGVVLGVGRVSSWDREPGAVLACAALGIELPVGRVVVHHELSVRLTGAVTGDRKVPWWVTADGVAHCSDGWERPRGH